jgi:hypothetical protein
MYVCMYLFTANGPKSGGRITVEHIVYGLLFRSKLHSNMLLFVYFHGNLSFLL